MTDQVVITPELLPVVQSLLAQTRAQVKRENPSYTNKQAYNEAANRVAAALEIPEADFFSLLGKALSQIRLAKKTQQPAQGPAAVSLAQLWGPLFTPEKQPRTNGNGHSPIKAAQQVAATSSPIISSEKVESASVLPALVAELKKARLKPGEGLKVHFHSQAQALQAQKCANQACKQLGWAKITTKSLGPGVMVFYRGYKGTK